MSYLEQWLDDLANTKVLLGSVGITRCREVVIALVAVILPLLCALPLLRREDTTWHNSGLQGISVVALVESQEILYATSAEGVFRSADGLRWQAINRGLPLTVWEGIAIHTLVVHPYDSSQAYALVSGPGKHLELYRTTNRGENWNRATLPPDPFIIATLVLFPDQHATLYTVSTTSIYRSNDSGQTWIWHGVVPSGTQPKTLTIAHQSADTLFLGTDGHGVLFSDDGGRSWQANKVGLGKKDIRQLIVSPADPNVLFVLAEGRVYRSLDCGTTWQSLGLGLEGKQITALAAHPTRAEVVYAGTNDGQILITAAAGSAWMNLGTNPGAAAVQALVLDQRHVLVATGSGVWQYHLDVAPASAPPSTAEALDLAAVPTGAQHPSPSPTRAGPSFWAASEADTSTPMETPAPTLTWTATPEGPRQRAPEGISSPMFVSTATNKAAPTSTPTVTPTVTPMSAVSSTFKGKLTFKPPLGLSVNHRQQADGNALVSRGSARKEPAQIACLTQKETSKSGPFLARAETH